MFAHSFIHSFIPKLLRIGCILLVCTAFEYPLQHHATHVILVPKSIELEEAPNCDLQSVVDAMTAFIDKDKKPKTDYGYLLDKIDASGSNWENFVNFTILYKETKNLTGVVEQTDVSIRDAKTTSGFNKVKLDNNTTQYYQLVGAFFGINPIKNKKTNNDYTDFCNALNNPTVTKYKTVNFVRNARNSAQIERVYEESSSTSATAIDKQCRFPEYKVNVRQWRMNFEIKRGLAGIVPPAVYQNWNTISDSKYINIHLDIN